MSGTFHSGGSDVTCRFGSIFSISAMSVSNDWLECTTPSHMVETVECSVGLLGDGYVADTLYFKFTSPCSSHACTLSGGISSVKTDLAIYADNCVSRATHSCVGLQQGIVSVGLFAHPINCFAFGGSLGCWEAGGRYSLLTLILLKICRLTMSRPRVLTCSNHR